MKYSKHYYDLKAVVKQSNESSFLERDIGIMGDKCGFLVKTISTFESIVN